MAALPVGPQASNWHVDRGENPEPRPVPLPRRVLTAPHSTTMRPGVAPLGTGFSTAVKSLA